MKNILKQIIFEQRNIKRGKTVLRDFPAELETCSEIVVISGIRRCGKSVLLEQIKTRQKEKDYFLNFDDERLINFKVADFQLLHETFIELFGEQKTFYFDEIQNIQSWERFIRRLYDAGCKIFLTGSNATMLSRELGTHLTGRYYRFELFPFSFKEYLLFKNITLKEQNFYTTSGKAEIRKQFNEFFLNGGFPMYLQDKNDLFFKSLYESILYRDVMVRNNLTNEKEILELVYYLISNVSNLSSNNSLAKTVGIKNATTIKNYIEYLQNTYLLFQVSKFDYSLKKQLHNPKKTYFIDNALINKLGFSFSENTGRLLENIVFIELKRRGMDVFYFKMKNECDFVIRTGNKIIQAIQVCYTFENNKTKEREIAGLTEAMNVHSLNYGLIITDRIEEEIKFDKKRIFLVPAWKWLLGK